MLFIFASYLAYYNIFRHWLSIRFAFIRILSSCLSISYQIKNTHSIPIIERHGWFILLWNGISTDLRDYKMCRHRTSSTCEGCNGYKILMGSFLTNGFKLNEWVQISGFQITILLLLMKIELIDVENSTIMCYTVITNYQAIAV